MPVIRQTERLIIRTWEETDQKHYLDLANDVGFHAFSTPGFYLAHTPAEVAAKINTRRKVFAERKMGKFLVVEGASGETVGSAGIDPYPLDGQEYFELGYRLCLKHWGKGYATEAAEALLDYGFTSLNLEKIVAFAVHQNSASLKVIEKLGFVYTRDILHLNLPSKFYEMEKRAWLAR